MVLVLVLVLILATSPFYAAAGLGLPCITRSFVRPFGSVQLLDTEHVIGDRLLKESVPEALSEQQHCCIYKWKPGS
jgi:hypothetical protein